MSKENVVVVWCITYNQVDYIEDALKGFLIQKTNFKFEVVVHDDASTDGTTDIVKYYEKQHPDIITSYIEKVNQWKIGGLPRIIGLMNRYHRRGKFIALCEGDDYWTDPNKLQRQVDFLESHKDYSMCFHSALKKYECNATCWINCEKIKDKDYDATDVFVNWTIPTASILCRAEALHFYESLKSADHIQNYDIFIILSCAMTGKIRGIHDQMSVYRIQDSGLTYNQQAVKLTTMRNPAHFICIKENFPIVQSRYINDTISKTYFERALIQSSRKNIMDDLYKSFKYNPFRCLKMATKTIKNSIKSWI